MQDLSDLGAVDEPLMICGGAFGNAQALEALLEEAGRRRFSAERIVHTGDAVAYCAEPAQTSELLRANVAHCIRGNVEDSLVARAKDCGCGFAHGTLCNSLAEKWFAHADAEVGPELRSWMATLPAQLAFTMAGKQARVIHGGVQVVNAYIFCSTPADTFAHEFAAAEADMIIGGHCGLPFTRHDGRRIWHNSGALGLPANDGTPRVWFSIATPLRVGIKFEHAPLRYDFELARRRMIEAGLPLGYVDALRSGLWPSLSILPETERAQTGKRLDPHSLNSIRLAAAE